MTDTLGDALPREIARVRDEVLPVYVALGFPGQIAATMMRRDLDVASEVMISGDLLGMIRVYQSLKGYFL